MKRSKIAILMIMVICCLGYTMGCASNTEQKNSKKDKKVYDSSLVSEVISEDGTYSDEYGSYDYSFHVPQLVSESKDAKVINQEIMDKMGTLAQDSLQAMGKQEFPLSSAVSWSGAWKGSILSLLITEHPSSGPANYMLYNFDFKEEKVVDNDEIFKLLDITKEEFLTVAKKSAFESMNYWDDTYDDFEENHIWMYYGGIYPLNVTTLQKIDANTAKIYVGEKEVQMVLEGFIPAGGGTYSQLITLDFERKEQPEKTVEYKGITAKLKDGKVFVQYDGESLEWIDVGSCLVDDDQLKGGKEYEVSGCYRDYIDMFISQAGNAQNAYLYLLTDDGNLEMVNLIKGASVGVLSSIPIPYIKNIVTVKSTVDNSKEVWSYAVEKDGKEHDLSIFADLIEKSPHQFLSYEYIYQTDKVTHQTDGGEAYNSYFELEFDENGKVDIREFLEGKSEAVKRYVGTMMPLGCNEEGTIYYFDMANKNGEEIYIGSFLIRNVMTMDEYGGIEFDQVEIKVNTGVDIFDTKGEWLKVLSTNSVG